MVGSLTQTLWTDNFVTLIPGKCELSALLEIRHLAVLLDELRESHGRKACIALKAKELLDDVISLAHPPAVTTPRHHDATIKTKKVAEAKVKFTPMRQFHHYNATLPGLAAVEARMNRQLEVIESLMAKMLEQLRELRDKLLRYGEINENVLGELSNVTSDNAQEMARSKKLCSQIELAVASRIERVCLGPDSPTEQDLLPWDELLVTFQQTARLNLGARDVTCQSPRTTPNTARAPVPQPNRNDMNLDATEVQPQRSDTAPDANILSLEGFQHQSRSDAPRSLSEVPSQTQPPAQVLASCLAIFEEHDVDPMEHVTKLNEVGEIEANEERLATRDALPLTETSSAPPKITNSLPIAANPPLHAAPSDIDNSLVATNEEIIDVESKENTISATQSQRSPSPSPRIPMSISKRKRQLSDSSDDVGVARRRGVGVVSVLRPLNSPISQDSQDASGNVGMGGVGNDHEVAMPKVACSGSEGVWEVHDESEKHIVDDDIEADDDPTQPRVMYVVDQIQ